MNTLILLAAALLPSQDADAIEAARLLAADPMTIMSGEDPLAITDVGVFVMPGIGNHLMMYGYRSEVSDRHYVFLLGGYGLGTIRVAQEPPNRNPVWAVFQ